MNPTDPYETGFPKKGTYEKIPYRDSVGDLGFRHLSLGERGEGRGERGEGRGERGEGRGERWEGKGERGEGSCGAPQRREETRGDEGRRPAREIRGGGRE